MHRDNQTFQRFLSEENPKLTRMKTSSISNSTTKHDSGWGWPAEIKEWTDFNFENLKAEHLDLLQQEFSFPYLHPPSELPFLEIHDEGSFEVVLIQWTHPRVSEALEKSQQWNQTKPQDRIYMVKGGQAEHVPPPKLKLRKSKPSHPDWGGIKRLFKEVDKKRKYWNDLPGETKLSRKWRSKDITVGEVWPEFDPGKHYPDTSRSYQYDQLWLPLRQIFSYCTRLGRKYGYIITDKELVVVRVFAESEYNDGNPQTAGRLEYKAIYWKKKDCPKEPGETPELTVNLALWWLYDMARREERLDWPHQPYEAKTQPADARTTLQNIEEDSTLVSKTPVNSFVSNTSHVRRLFDSTDLTETDEDSSEGQNDVARVTRSKRGNKRPPEKVSSRREKMRKGSSRR